MASTNPTTALDQLPADVAEVVRRATTVLVPVDDGSDGARERARQVAMDLAVLGEARLVLLDRLDTTYADTPRINELSRDEATGIDRDYLLPFFDEAAERGLAVTAFQHSMPGSEAFTSAVERVGADLVVAPASLDEPGIWDRLKRVDQGEMVEEAVPDSVAVVIVGDEGELTLR